MSGPSREKLWSALQKPESEPLTEDELRQFASIVDYYLKGTNAISLTDEEGWQKTLLLCRKLENLSSRLSGESHPPRSE